MSQIPAPPEALSATMKGLGLGASPSLLTRQSSVNTTPRQGNRRMPPVADDSSRKSGLRRSLGNSGQIAPSMGSGSISLVSKTTSSNLELGKQDALRSRALKKPNHPSMCSLLCCFYAEFDIKVGPKIVYQSPDRFMEQDIRLKAKHMEKMLATAFDNINTKNTDEINIAETVTNEPISPIDLREEGQDASSPLSIFDSCSEYIITGNELTGNIINLSTHHIHVLTRPTIITDAKYERNSLLFCVGFVLRRNDDPRPYRPVLSKLALTLRDMEVESQFLSGHRPQIQMVLENILFALNSTSSECNLSLGRADVLNLKLFRPQKPLANPVKDYDVPILLHRDWQVQSYDRDLSINWVSLWIDGIANAKQISKRAEVDLEMVRACLRVLKHYEVIALVDIFSYSNHYECTAKIALDSKLLNEAVEFAVKRGTLAASARPVALHRSISPGTSNELDLTECQTDSLLDPSDTIVGEGSYPRMASGGSSRHDVPISDLLRKDEIDSVKVAILEFFCGCERKVSVGDLWISFISQQSSRVTSRMGTDWRKMFHTLDHRRLITFGIVNGLIRRVHNFPLYTKLSFDVEDNLAHLSMLDDRAKSSSQQGHVKHNRFRSTLKNRAASMMDGSNCDDFLMCELDLTLDAIIDLFEEESIVSVFAIADR